jgi:hypothetical protein
VADVTVPNTVYPSANAQLYAGFTAAQNTEAGKIVFLNASNQWELTDASDATHGAAVNAVVGIAVNLANTNQPLTVTTLDDVLTLGSGLSTGEVYVASTNAGMFMPESDLSNADYRIVLGAAISNAALQFKPTSTGANGA